MVVLVMVLEPCLLESKLGNGMSMAMTRLPGRLKYSPKPKSPEVLPAENIGGLRCYDLDRDPVHAQSSYTRPFVQYGGLKN